MTNKTRISVHVYPSSITHATRILRMTETLVVRTNIKKIIVIGTAEKSLPLDEIIDEHRRVKRIPTLEYGQLWFLKLIKFFEFYVRSFLELRNQQIDVINCHSLSALPLCVMIKWWHNAELVYEPHELETETGSYSRIGKALVKWVESNLIRKAARVIVVSESIANRYRLDYNIDNVSTILNVPKSNANQRIERNLILRKTFKIPKDHLVFMYQGLFDHVRCVPTILDAFCRVPRDHHLVLMGFGPLEANVRAVAEKNSHVHYLPPVSSEDVLKLTLGADIGLALLTDTCLNHQFALPNKLFHYLHANLPVVVSQLDEMQAIVDRYHCGWKVENGVDALTDCISSIQVSDIESRSLGASTAKTDFNWEKEANKLASIYEGLL